MSGRLRVALVGAGNVAVGAHLPAWAAVPEAQLVMVVDSRAEAARAVAQAHGIPAWNTNLGEALADPAVDAVDLCTPAALHAEQARAALAAGKHVLLEKPMTLTLADADSLVEAAAGSDRVAMVTENWVYAPSTRRVHDLVASGAIGEPFLLQARNETPFLLRAFERPEQTDRDHLGYTFVGGIHSLAVGRYLMGEPESVVAFANTSDIDTRVGIAYDTDIAVSCRFQRGGLGSFVFSGHSPLERARVGWFALSGPRGRIDFDIDAGWVDWVEDGVRNLATEAQPSAGHREAVRHFVDCVLQGARPQTDFADQAQTLRFVHAIYEAIVPRAHHGGPTNGR